MPGGLFGAFQKKPKTPGELVSKLRNALKHIDTGTKDRSAEKTGKDATDLIGLLKESLLGDDPPAAPPSPADVVATINAVLATDVLCHMVTSLPKLPFETRKDVVAIFSFICKHRPSSQNGQGGASSSSAQGNQSPRTPSRNGSVSAFPVDTSGRGFLDTPGLEHVRLNLVLVEKLCAGYKVTTVALNCGVMLRDAMRDPTVTRYILESPLLDDFFDYVQINAFEVASDAFTTFKRLLTQHDIVADFLLVNHTRFFSKYEDLLKSKNYATQRQSLKLLADILLARSNVRVMFTYVRSKQHLMLVMNLLRSSSRTIQHEAFHVFKVFVANPKKPADIRNILIGNREKLLRFLKQFLEEREAEDEDFAREKADIMKEIEMMKEEDPGTPVTESAIRSVPSTRDLSACRSNQSFRAFSDGSHCGSHAHLADHATDDDMDTTGACAASNQSISHALSHHSASNSVL